MSRGDSDMAGISINKSGIRRTMGYSEAGQTKAV